MGYKRNPMDEEFVNGQIATYGCAHCDYSVTCRLDQWLPIRDRHWKAVHPKIRIRKRRLHRIQGVTATVRDYEGRLIHRKELAA